MRQVALGDVAAVYNGKTPSKSDQRASGHPVLKIRDVTDSQQFSGEFGSFVESAFAEKFREKLLKAGDFLILNAAHNADYVGSKQYIAGRQVEGALPTGEWAVVRSSSPLLSQGYLNRWLGSALVRKKIRELVKGIHLYPKDLARLEISLPPLNEQRRIAAILDKADAIRRKRQQALSESASLEQSVFLAAVGPQAKEYRDWEPVSFEELAKPGKGTMRTGPFGSDLRHSEFVDEGVAVLGIDNAVQNRFAWAGRRFITQEKYEKLTRYTVFPGDVIVTIMGTTGRSAVVPDDIPLAITTKHLATITPDRSKVEPEFLSNALHRHPAVLSQIKMANKGAIMDGLNLGIIKGLQVPLPPIEVQRQYVADLVRVRAMQAKMLQDYLKADRLFASLSQRAFRGDLSPAHVPA